MLLALNTITRSAKPVFASSLTFQIVAISSRWRAFFKGVVRVFEGSRLPQKARAGVLVLVDKIK